MATGHEFTNLADLASARVGGRAIATNDDFTFIGATVFTGPGQVMYAVLGTSTYVWANVDGTTTTAEWAVEIVGRQLTLTAADFIL